jgi:peptidoglycan hydrolase-like protein with peptidoglycan-binding domain
MAVKPEDLRASSDVVRLKPGASARPGAASEQPGGSASLMGRRRTLVLFAVLGLSAVATVGGWLAGSRIESPADAAARTAPPAPSPILVPIEQRILSSDIITRGTARFGLPQPISIAPSTLKPEAGLITTLPLRNTQLLEGAVMLTASGRPVFVLEGSIPSYRDLVPGISGDDVRQLEQGLARLGFAPGPVDGSYDQQTSAAVARWYKAAGREPFGPTAEQLTRVRTLESDLANATKMQLAAVDAAAAAVRAVESARVTAAHADKAASAEIATRISERALILLDPRTTTTARAAAEEQLEVARAAAVAARAQGELAVQAALDAQKVAELDARLETDRADQIASDLSLAKRKLGFQVPVDEIVFLPALPVRVEEVTARVGDPARGPVMTVTDNQLAIDSSLTLDAAPLVRPGMRVAIDEQAVGIKATGVVSRVADTPGTHGVDGYHIYFEVRVDETPTRLEGFSLRLTIPIESTRGAVTAVPVSALSLAADGTSRVQVENGGELHYVVVEPGLSADGFVEVTPVDGKLVPGQLVVVGYDTAEKP